MNALRKFLSDNGIDEADLSKVALQVGNQGVRPVTGPQISAEEFLRGQEEGRYATGKPFQVDPSKQGFGALFDENTGKFRSGGYVRDESTGQTTTFTQPQRPRGVRTFGVDPQAGAIKDMGAAQIDGDPVDYSYVDGFGRQGVRKVQVQGLGEGVMGKDGFVYGRDNAGNPIWRAQAFSQQQEMANYDQDLKRQKMEAEIGKLRGEGLQTREKPAPAGYRWTQDGSRLEPIPGGPAAEGKPLTDAQSKALLFGNRMAAAENIFGELAKEGVNASVPGSRAPLIGGVINALQPESRQRLDQAKRDFINAVLRRESGAVISDSEFDNAEKQYFPQIGEGAAIIEQKRKARELAQRSIEVEVPESQRGKGREPAQGGLPPKSQLQRGQIYNTPRGRAVWTGDRFEAV
jgi:hypothetical protein